MDSRPSIEPAVYAGPPPVAMEQIWSGDVAWRCECGATGISSNQIWAESDVNRHRRMHDTLWPGEFEKAEDSAVTLEGWYGN